MPPLRFSLELPTTRADRPEEFVDAAAIAEVTAAAATAGFGAVSVTDHPAPDGRWLDLGGHHALDPFVALSFAATADPTILLQTNVYVPAYRNPFLGAKSIQSLDLLSGGRLLLGVAAGYLKPEFAALGADFDGRGVRLDESLEVLDALYRGNDVSWSARTEPQFVSRRSRLRPLPTWGRPPIWVGGNSRRAMRRALRYDGWAPFHTGGYATATRTVALESIDELAAAVGWLRSELPAHRADSFDVCWSGGPLEDPVRSVDERVATAVSLADAGVSWAVVRIPTRDRAELLERIAAFGQEVIAGRAVAS